VDALALDGDEGRGYLRKASGRGKHPLIRGCPNGETLPGKTRKRPAESIGGYERTQGSEPSQYLEEEKTIVIPLVAASERRLRPLNALIPRERKFLKGSGDGESSRMS